MHIKVGVSVRAIKPFLHLLTKPAVKTMLLIKLFKLGLGLGQSGAGSYNNWLKKLAIRRYFKRGGWLLKPLSVGIPRLPLYQSICKCLLESLILKKNFSLHGTLFSALAAVGAQD